MHLIVLDLNGVLACKRGQGRTAILRPKVKEFVMRLMEWSDNGLVKVAVWTSMTKTNASVIIDQLFDPFQQQNLLFIWFSDQCTPCHDRPYKKHKDLQKVWADFPQYSEHNTTLFDDSEFKGQRQPKNLYLVDTFDMNNKEDDALSTLQEYISRVITHSQNS